MAMVPLMLLSSKNKKRLLWWCLGGSPLGIMVVVGVLLFAVAVAASSILGGGPPTGGTDPTSAQAPGVPAQLLQAYVQGAKIVNTAYPQCHGMRWEILAGIGQIESSSTAGHTISANGDVTPHIIGPPIGFADTDGGKWDGSSTQDFAVGPMQFLPSTFKEWGIDGNADGVIDPHNIYDATATAGAYLCGKAPADLTNLSVLRQSIYRYNHSWTYVDNVITQIQSFDASAASAPAAGGGGGGGGGTAATGSAATVLAAAEKWLGTPYAWGGGTANGPSLGQHDGGVADSYGDYKKIGFDCSGLALYAYAQVGIVLPHSSAAQFRMGTRIPRSAGIAALKPGDLVFFATDPATGAGVHHVGIYVGNGQMINAPYSGVVVRYDPLDMSQYAGAARFV